MEGRELRRSVTLSEQLSVVDSSSLGDLLKIREEEDTRFSRSPENDSADPESGIAREKRERSADSNIGARTLLDIILLEHGVNGSLAGGNSSRAAAWKSLRDHFRLHSPESACEMTSPERLRPISEPELSNSALSHPIPVSPSDSSHNSGVAISEPPIIAPAPAAATTEAQELPSLSGSSDEINFSEDSDPGGAVDSSAPVAVAEEEEEEEPARVSLMSLLEQTDRQWGGSGRVEGLSLMTAVPEEAAVDDAESCGGVMLYMCCVCMIRHKGAAFIPCGHTFCRLCSRELWVSRGNCPLCNRHIAEILDIF